ncbi:MAG: peroxiredoxin-like family protein [Pseudomonadota bacterium]
MIRNWIYVATVLFSGAALAEVPDRAEDVQPLQVGDDAPTFTALDPNGAPVEFSAEGNRSLLIFYRGGWCPYCNRHLQALRDVVPTLASAGVDVLFLSADRPEKLAESLSEQNLDYRLLSDASMAVSRAYGVAFRVDDETVEKYKGFGIDLEAASGYTHHQLPVPAVYLVDADGMIEFVHTNADYRVRLSADALLSAAGVSSGD